MTHGQSCHKARAMRRISPSIRHTLILAGVVALAVVVAVALAAGLGLSRAHHVLTRSGYSQEQLAIATRLEAEVNAYVARAALATAPRAAQERADDRAGIEALLAQYAASIRAEHRFLAEAGEKDDADSELATVRQLGALFADIRRDADRSIEPQALARDLDRFQHLVRATVAQERDEVAAALASFDRERGIVRSMAIGLPLAGGIAGVIGLMLLLGRLKHPLRRFEAAMAAVARGDSADLGGMGFAEFETLALGFDRMTREITAQRAALHQVNARLEGDVALRTAELQTRNSQLAEIEANRRLFFAQISHELRTPITALQCEAEVALRMPRPDVAMLRQALEQVLVQGSFARRRLNDLLTISQAEDGRLVMADKPFDLGDAVRAGLAMAEPFARASEARLESTIPGDPLPVHGDAGWMQQALLALLDNAIKFSPDAAVSVGLKRSADEAVLTIGDSGPGVPEAALTRLFDRFHQEPEGRARGGSGLGLSVARWVVDHHRGRIAASNRAGGGLCMTIALPLQQSSAFGGSMA
ncbi:sensor histidine kinase [Novosphingobium terrae]|uniref:sensor histidine kinase n=1 Tax=Novosphingobium terrae TaxID=2726189 RepID=UPI00197EF146|nr:HAMP domain-containing sensor histidine kinase [Novosphingobium terrae]